MLGWFNADAARASRGQELESDEATKLGVLSPVDHTHPAATELLDDAVVRDGLVNHERAQDSGCNVRGAVMGSQFRVQGLALDHAELGKASAAEQFNDGYCSATASISICASLGRAATWTVERDGGSFLKNCP